MNKEYKQSSSEFSTPPYEEIPKETISYGPEYSDAPHEYIAHPDEYHESGHANTNQQTPKKHKHKMVYLIASAAACFTIFTVALDPKEESLFPNFNDDFTYNDYYEDQLEKDESDKDDDFTNESESEDISGNSTEDDKNNIPDSAPDSDKEPSTSVFAGKMFSNIAVTNSNNYLIAIINRNGLSCDLIDYDGNLLYTTLYSTNEWQQTMPDIHGPNDMGYTTFYFNDKTVNRTEIVDAKGKVVFTTTETSEKNVALGDSDILYQKLTDENGYRYVTYTKLDGTILFDSRQHCDTWPTGYPFRNGHALIVLPYNDTDVGNRYVIMDRSGNIRDIPTSLPSDADILGIVDDYFVAETTITQNTYVLQWTLVETTTGTVVGTLDWEATKEALGLNTINLSKFSADGELYYHYGTYGIINDHYLFDFRDIGDDGIPNNIVDLKDTTIYFAPRDFLVCEDNTKNDTFYYINWDGKRVSPIYNGASAFNREGYALISVHSETNEIHVVDEHFNVVEVLPGRIEYPKYTGDVVNIEYEGPEDYDDYYYGHLKEPKTTYSP